MIKKQKILGAIIIGDVVDSRTLDQNSWLPLLEEAIQGYTNKYDIFRGDSFQLQVSLELLFECVFYIKATLKTIGLDVRIGIGIGEIDQNKNTIKQSSGEAFILSGIAFDSLEKETFFIKTTQDELDITLNLMLQLSSEIANRWTKDMAASIAAALKNPTVNQKDLAKLLHKKYQSQISTKLTKAGFPKIKRVIQYATHEVLKKC